MSNYVEQTDHVCEKCRKNFSCVDERNDDYKNYCSDCYKKMISSRYDDMDQADQEYFMSLNEG